MSGGEPSTGGGEVAHEARHGPALAGAARAFGGVTLLSRIGGLLRDVLLVRVFGATATGSAFAAAFAIPNMFRRLFGEGALSAAFVPEYAQAVKADPALADQLATWTVRRLALATGLIMLLAQAATVAALLLAPPDPERALSLRLIVVMLPFMPLVCVAAVLAGMLQVHGKFAASAGGALVLNAFIIAVGLWSVLTGTLGGETTAYVLGAATVLSGVTQVWWFARVLRPSVRWTRGTALAREAARRMVGRFVPVMIGMGTLQLNGLVDTLIAMWPIWVGPTVLGVLYPLDEASNSILSFTMRLYQFPLGVFGIAVATAALPLLSRHADEPAPFSRTLRRGLRLSLFIGLPASLGLLLVREDLTYVMFAGGNAGFGEQVGRSAAVLMGFAPGVFAYALNHVYTRAFYACGDTRTPVRIAIGAMGLNLALNLTLIWHLREAGLAWATSAAAVAQCLVLGAVAERRFGRRLDASGAAHAVHDRATVLAMARIVLASLLMAGAVLAADWAWPPADRWTPHAVRLGVLMTVGAGAYALAAVLLRCDELPALLRRSRPV
ncbi:MAG: murein biosynthesis integral membrane protein MurJ [Phycisphaerae bacterium]|nr:murein biosynthesis integral membrane protein MurJ [Phycisphaerae bacterium]